MIRSVGACLGSIPGRHDDGAGSHCKTGEGGQGVETPRIIAALRRASPEASPIGTSGPSVVNSARYCSTRSRREGLNEVDETAAVVGIAADRRVDEIERRGRQHGCEERAGICRSDRSSARRRFRSGNALAIIPEFTRPAKISQGRRSMTAQAQAAESRGGRRSPRVQAVHSRPLETGPEELHGDRKRRTRAGSSTTIHESSVRRAALRWLASASASNVGSRARRPAARAPWPSRRRWCRGPHR